MSQRKRETHGQLSSLFFRHYTRADKRKKKAGTKPGIVSFGVGLLPLSFCLCNSLLYHEMALHIALFMFYLNKGSPKFKQFCHFFHLIFLAQRKTKSWLFWQASVCLGTTRKTHMTCRKFFWKLKRCLPVDAFCLLLHSSHVGFLHLFFFPGVHLHPLLVFMVLVCGNI